MGPETVVRLTAVGGGGGAGAASGGAEAGGGGGAGGCARFTPQAAARASVQIAMSFIFDNLLSRILHADVAPTAAVERSST